MLNLNYIIGESCYRITSNPPKQNPELFLSAYSPKTLFEFIFIGKLTYLQCNNIIFFYLQMVN